jgi:hypothetical protein
MQNDLKKSKKESLKNHLCVLSLFFAAQKRTYVDLINLSRSYKISKVPKKYIH